jgi:hypothetical protein
VYAEEVIANLKKISGKNSWPDLAMLIEAIKASQKFYFNEIPSSFEGVRAEECYDWSDTKLPFPTVWVAFEDSTYSYAGLVLEHPMRTFGIHLFVRDKDKGWALCPSAVLISGDNDIAKGMRAVGIPNEAIKEHLIEKTSEHVENIYLFNLLEGLERPLVYEGLLAYAAKSINWCFSLLNCKNIITEEITPKNGKKRKRKGKKELFTYHILKVQPTSKKYNSEPQDLWKNRIHLARGHFKTFTADKPLFGRITGTFWWQPQVRGRNKEGIVVKDYNLETQKHTTQGGC